MKATKPRSLKDLKPNPRNPRVMTDWKRDALRSALEKFGDLGGIVFNVRTGHLVGGHQRVEQFQALDGKAKVHVTQRFKTPTKRGTIALGYLDLGGERHSYREVDWEITTEQAANLAANQHGGEFDWELVSELLQEIKDMENLDLLTGFSQDELANLLQADWTKAEVGEIPTHPPESDTVHLSTAARELIERVKEKLKQDDDNIAIEQACLSFLGKI